MRTLAGQLFGEHPDELQGAMAEAFAVNGPAIVDCVVAADELPNIRHINLDIAAHYAKYRKSRAQELTATKS